MQASTWFGFIVLLLSLACLVNYCHIFVIKSLYSAVKQFGCGNCAGYKWKRGKNGQLRKSQHSAGAASIIQGQGKFFLFFNFLNL
jgi:hypothetical protein